MPRAEFWTKIAVIGDRNSGKTSLIQSLLRLPLPNGYNVSTRVPVIIRSKLQNVGSQEENVSIDGIYEQGTTSTQIFSRLSEMNSLQSEKFMPLDFEISTCTLGKCQLMDTPGYTLQSDNQNLQGKINNLLQDLLDDDSVILIVTVNAKFFGTSHVHDIVTRAISNRSDPQVLKRRIFWCLTNCDTFQHSDVPNNIRNIFSKTTVDDIYYPNGWFATVSGTDKKRLTSNLNQNILTIQKQEIYALRDIPFFENNDLKSRCSISSLRDCLRRYSNFII